MEINWMMVALFLYLTGIISTALLVMAALGKSDKINYWRLGFYIGVWPALPLHFLLDAARGKV